MISCTGSREKRADSSKLWAQYDALKQAAEHNGEFSDPAYECRISLGQEKQSFYFGCDEKGNVTQNLTFIKNDMGYDFSFSDGKYANVPYDIVSACAVCIDKGSDRYSVLISGVNETRIYDVVSESPELVNTIEGNVGGFFDGALIIERHNEELYWVDIYKLCPKGDGYFMKSASFCRDHYRPQYFITTAETNAYSRKGFSCVSAGRVLALSATIYNAFGGETTAYYTDDITGVGYCVPLGSLQEYFGVLHENMRRFDLDALSQEELLGLVFPDDRSEIDPCSWERECKKLERVDFSDLTMQFDIDGDGADDIIVHQKTGSIYPDDRVDVNNSNSVQCPHEIVSIGRLDLDPNDGCTEFFVYGIGLGEFDYKECTFLYHYIMGSLEEAALFYGELYGTTGDGAFITVCHDQGRAKSICVYKYEPDAEEGACVGMETEYFLNGGQPYTVLSAFEAHNAEGVIGIPAGSEITVVKAVPSPFASINRTIFFTFDGDECFVLLAEGLRLNGKPWNSFIIPE